MWMWRSFLSKKLNRSDAGALVYVFTNFFVTLVVLVVMTSAALLQPGGSSEEVHCELTKGCVNAL